jgi:starvation-inducible outer membrane lipoprotein
MGSGLTENVYIFSGNSIVKFCTPREMEISKTTMSQTKTFIVSNDVRQVNQGRNNRAGGHVRYITNGMQNTALNTCSSVIKPNSLASDVVQKLRTLQDG